MSSFLYRVPPLHDMMKPETVKTREKDNTETTQRQHRDNTETTQRQTQRQTQKKQTKRQPLRIKEVKTKETIDLRIPTYET